MMDRRTLLTGAAAAALFAPAAFAASDATMAAMMEFTGGAEPAEGGVTLTAPEIAENGNTVPIEVSAPGAAAILILATDNPNPEVGTIAFGPLAASQSAATRIRLARTQDVVAIARMPDGRFLRASREIKVTIGGCGG